MVNKLAIIHSEIQGGEYRLLADFFRICGIGVYNYAVTEQTDFASGEDFDLVLIIATKPNPKYGDFCLNHEQKEAAKSRYSGCAVVFEDDEPDWKCDKERERIQYLRKRLREIDQNFPGMFSLEDTKTINKLVEIYVGHELMKYRVALNSFVLWTNIVTVVRNHYEAAYLELIQWKEWKEWETDSEYRWFAMRHLERYVNECRGFLKQSLLFDTGKEVEFLEKRLEQYTDNSIRKGLIYQLIAQFMEADFSFYDQAGGYYKKAVDSLDGSVLASYPCYRLGRDYEKNKHDWETGKQYYEKALNMDPREYRAAYKLGDYWRLVGKRPERALEEYLKIDAILKERVEHFRIQPKEAEYYYKAWNRISLLYDDDRDRKLRNDISKTFAQERMKRIVEVVRDSDSDKKRDKKDICYEVIFGSNASLQIDAERGNERNARELVAERIAVVCPK